MSTPNHPPIDTPSNHGPVVGVLTWFLLAATILAVVARVLTKFAISRRLTSDDYLIFAALASLLKSSTEVIFAKTDPQMLSVGQGVAVAVQTSNGVGQHDTALSASQLNRYYKVTWHELFELNR